MKKSFWLSIPISIFAITLGLILRSLLANNFEKDNLATYYGVIDAIFLATLPFLGFRSTMTIYYAKEQNYALCVNRQRIAMILAFIPMLVLSIMLEDALNIHANPFVVLFLLSSVLFGLYANNQLGMLRLYGAINIASTLEPIAALLFYLVFLPKDTNMLLVTFSFAFLLSGIFAIFYKRKQKFYEPKLQKPSFKNSADFYKDSLFASLEFGFGMALLFMASFIASAKIDELADFQVVIKPILLYSMTIFVFPILRFIAPEVAKYLTQNNISQYKKLSIFTIKYAIFVFIILAVILYWRKEIVEFIFSKDYILSADALLLVPFAILFAILNTFALSALKSIDKFAISLLVRIFGFCWFCLGYFLVNSLTHLCAWLALSHFAMFATSNYILKKELALRCNMSK